MEQDIYHVVLDLNCAILFVQCSFIGHNFVYAIRSSVYKGNGNILHLQSTFSALYSLNLLPKE